MASAFIAAAPWTDRAGRFSRLKAAVFAATVLPGLVMLIALASGDAGPRPFDFAVHETGEWGVRFLLASLAVSPLRRILDLPSLIQVRRMLGLAAFAYLAVHVGFYVVDQRFDLVKVATEIALRVYLTIGFVAFAGLAALAATSTDAAIRRMGRGWVRLHKAVYVLTGLGLLHYFMQSKIDVTLPTLYAGLFVLLMAYRGVHGARLALAPPMLAAVALAGVAGTMALEFAWYALATNVPAERVFAANFDTVGGIRPAWWVGAAGLAVAALALARGGLSGTRTAAAPTRRRAGATG